MASRVRKAKDEVIKAMRVRLVDLVSYSRNVLGTDAIRLGFVGSPALCLAKLAKEDYPIRPLGKLHRCLCVSGLFQMTWCSLQELTVALRKSRLSNRPSQICVAYVGWKLAQSQCITMGLQVETSPCLDNRAYQNLALQKSNTQWVRLNSAI